MASDRVVVTYTVIITFNVILTVCALWLFVRITQQVFNQIRGNDAANGSRSRNFALSQRRNKVRTTMLLVQTSSVMFTIGVIITLVRSIITFAYLQSSEKRLNERYELNLVTLGLALMSFVVFLTAYISLTSAMFHRYQMIFEMTLYRFSDESMRWIHGVMLAEYMSGIIGTVCLIMGVWRIVSLLTLTFSSIVYPILSLIQIYHFLRSTISLSSEVRRFTLNNDTRNKEKGERLFNSSLRLTIITSTAICSSFTLGIMTVVRTIFNQVTPLSVLNILLSTLDAIVNLLALLLLFKEYESLFFHLCGSVHHFLSNRWLSQVRNQDTQQRDHYVQLSNDIL